MYRQNTVLIELLEPVVQAMGYELLGIEQLARGRDTLLRIYIDNDAGIRLDDCARVSDQVAGVLDVNDPIKGSYILEVSSPGSDRPLFTLDHFRRFTGHIVRLALHDKIAGRRKMTGEITAVSEAGVDIRMDGAVYQVAAENIDKARLVPV